jgi:hypothetical protein
MYLQDDGMSEEMSKMMCLQRLSYVYISRPVVMIQEQAVERAFRCQILLRLKQVNHQDKSSLR